MLDDPGPSLDAETIRRVASEQVRISLKPAEVDAIQALLKSLLEEIRQITPRDRATAEPEPVIAVEDWPA